MKRREELLNHKIKPEGWNGWPTSQSLSGSQYHTMYAVPRGVYMVFYSGPSKFVVFGRCLVRCSLLKASSKTNDNCACSCLESSREPSSSIWTPNKRRVTCQRAEWSIPHQPTGSGPGRTSANCTKWYPVPCFPVP